MLTELLAVSVTVNVCLAVLARVWALRSTALEARLTVAQERLIAARQEHWLIPTPAELQGDVALPPTEPDLLPGLQAIIDEWEEPVHQAAQRQAIRSLAAQGLSQEAILRKLSPTPPDEALAA